VQGVRVPTLVIGSDGDALLSADYARSEVQAFFPGARLVILPCGHDIPLEMPTETAWLLQAFLAGIAASAAAAHTASPEVAASPA
jgi:pimeloyl-ACP methyl ester carboxylesterase